MPPGPAQRVWGRDLRPEDQLVLGEQPAPLRPLARQRPDARLQRAQVDHGRAVRPQDPLLRRGQLRRLQEGRRLRRRRDGQRPGAGRRRRVPGSDRPHASGSTSRAASSTWTATRPCATRGRATPRPTSTAAPASSACSCRSASRPTRRRSSRACPSSSPPSRRRSGPTSRSTSSTSCSGSPRRSTRRTSARTCSLRRSTQQDTCADSRGCVVLPNITRIKQAVKNAFTADPRDEALRQTLAGEGAQLWVLNGTSAQTIAEPGSRGTSSTTGWPPRRRAGNRGDRCRPKTVVTVYNGAEAKIPATIAYLEKLFDVKVTTKTDPAVRATSSSRRPEHARPAAAALVLSGAGESGPRPAAAYSIGVSQCWYAGQPPADRVEVAVAHEPRDRPDLARPDRSMVDLDRPATPGRRCRTRRSRRRRTARSGRSSAPAVGMPSLRHQLHQRLAGHALEQVVADRRGERDAVADRRRCSPPTTR